MCVDVSHLCTFRAVFQSTIYYLIYNLISFQIGEQTTGAIIAAPFFLPTTQELVPKFFQTEEDQTDEEVSEPFVQ